MLHQLATFMALAEKIVPRRSSIEATQSICFENGYMHVTDLENYARAAVDTKIGAVIPFSVIKRVLKSKPATLDITLIDEKKLKICFDNNSLTVPYTTPAEFPAGPPDGLQDIGVWSRDVLLHLHKQLPFTSGDELRPALTGVFIQQRGQLSSVATDGHIMQWILNLDPQGQCELKKEFSGILPEKAVQLVSRVAKGHVGVAAGKKYIRFLMKNKTELTCRLIEDEYIDFKRVISKESVNEIALDKAKLLDAIRAGRAFANSCTRQAVLHIRNGDIRMEVADEEDGARFETRIPVLRRVGEQMRIGFNLHLLETALNGVDEEIARWKFSRAEEPSVFSGNDHKLNLVMPIRLEDV